MKLLEELGNLLMNLGYVITYLYHNEDPWQPPR